MRETSSMFAGHIAPVFCEHFNGVFNAPATPQDGIEKVIEQREMVSALNRLKPYVHMY